MLEFESSERHASVLNLLQDPRIITNILSLRTDSVISKYRMFYMAPITKFWGNFVTFLFFLGLFSQFMLSKARYETIGVMECALMTYAVAATVEEVVQFHEYGDNYSTRLKNYFKPDTNKLDSAVLFMFMLTFLIRILRYDLFLGFSAAYITGHVTKFKQTFELNLFNNFSINTFCLQL